MELTGFIPFFCALVLSPFLFGIITRVKSIMSGRKGAPLLQLYYDLIKLFQKGAVYSNSTSIIFKICPAASMAAVLIAVLMLPQFGISPVISFQGDILMFIYLLGMIRFFLILGALDTASAFEGMGASREAFFSFLAEPVLLIALAALTKVSGDFTLYNVVNSDFTNFTVLVLLISAALFIILLSENSRIPVDDPNTHLELTMIHEVMVLDYSGPELGTILYTSAIKLWIFSSLVVQILLPLHLLSPITRFFVTICSIFICAIAIGIIESILARLRLIKVPQLLTGAGALAAIAFLFSSGRTM